MIKNLKLFYLVLILLFTELNFALNENKVSVYYEGRYRIIKSNGIPPHKVPQLKNKRNKSIIKRKIVAKIPLLPKESSKPIPVKDFSFGITKTGIIIDSSAIKFWLDKPSLKWEYNYFYFPKKVDQFNGYLNSKKEYFYKGAPLLKSNKKKTQKLIGYAADGFPIYNEFTNKKNKTKKLNSSYKLKKGQRVNGPNGNFNGQFNQDFKFVKNSGDLDACNGRFGITKEFKKGTYYYVLTTEYPYIPRCFKGIPDESFLLLKKQNQKPKKQFMRNSSY